MARKKQRGTAIAATGIATAVLIAAMAWPRGAVAPPGPGPGPTPPGPGPTPPTPPPAGGFAIGDLIHLTANVAGMPDVIGVVWKVLDNAYYSIDAGRLYTIEVYADWGQYRQGMSTRLSWAWVNAHAAKVGQVPPFIVEFAL